MLIKELMAVSFLCGFILSACGGGESTKNPKASPSPSPAIEENIPQPSVAPGVPESARFDSKINKTKSKHKK